MVVGTAGAGADLCGVVGFVLLSFCVGGVVGCGRFHGLVCGGVTFAGSFFLVMVDAVSPRG